MYSSNFNNLSGIDNSLDTNHISSTIMKDLMKIIIINVLLTLNLAKER